MRVHEILAAWAATKPTIVAIYVFGSRARGTAEPWSDLDLAVELDPGNGAEIEEELIRNSRAWRAELSSLTRLTIGPFCLHDNPIVPNEAIVVYRRK
jgi:predicted nucleotidyltransferase